MEVLSSRFVAVRGVGNSSKIVSYVFQLILRLQFQWYFEIPRDIRKGVDML